jgi:hypothetical protein
VALLLEDWAIWERFERHYRTGQLIWSGDDDEWGALPEERSRRREIGLLLQESLTVNSDKRIVARAEFRAAEPGEPDEIPGVMRRLEVRWVPVE